MISSDALARMRQQNIKEINKDDLVDIRSVVVDTSLPPEQRMMDYLEKIKNPYCFRCGDAVVSIHFADKGKEADFPVFLCYNHIVIIEDWRYRETRQKIF